jgi:hypothetical protein
MLRKELEWHYEKTEDNTARFVLGHAVPRPLICFGVNPSTATPEQLDPTLATVQRIALRHGYDGFIMCNLYPQRATNPDDMHDTRDDILHAANIRAIKKIFAMYPRADVLAAWGTLVQKRAYLTACLHEIVEAAEASGARWHCMGEPTKDGHPHHPLYLPRATQMQVFDVAAYAVSL